MTSIMKPTRRALLGAVPALGLTGVAFAQQPLTGTRITAPEPEPDLLLDAWVDAYGRPTAKVMVNNQGPFQFMVDTGSTNTVVTQALQDRLGVATTGEAVVAGTTGTAIVPLTSVAMLQTGVVSKKDLRVAVLPDVGAGVDGILGGDVFDGRRLVFNIRDRTVRVEPSRRHKFNTAFGNMRVRNGLLAEIDGRVGNVPAKLMLDTGAQNCIANLRLSEALAKAHPNLRRVDNVRIFGVTGQKLVGQFIALPRVDLKAFNVRDGGCVAVDAPIFDLWGLTGEPAMIVGVNLLSRLDSFSIDYGARVFDATLMSELMARNSVAFG